MLAGPAGSIMVVLGLWGAVGALYVGSGSVAVFVVLGSWAIATIAVGIRLLAGHIGSRTGIASLAWQ